MNDGRRVVLPNLGIERLEVPPDIGDAQKLCTVCAGLYGE